MKYYLSVTTNNDFYSFSFADICYIYHYSYCGKHFVHKKYIQNEPDHQLSSHFQFFFLSFQLGFMLLNSFWKFDFPPFMVLVIAILNDGNISYFIVS